MRFDPADEHQRLKELHRYRILDTRRDAAFDDLCELARAALDMPMAGIGFVDKDRIWFKSAIGLTAPSFSRQGTLVGAAVDHGGHLEVADACADPRFVDHPLVVGPPHLRFFASVPITVRDGLVIGVLCVGGTEPRRLADNQRFVMERIAHSVVDRLRLHRLGLERARDNMRTRARNAKIAAQQSEIGKQRLLLEQTTRIARIGGWEYDVKARRLVWSDQIFRILDMPVGSPPPFETVTRFYADGDRDMVHAHMKAALTQGIPFEAEFKVITEQGRRRWVRCVCEAERTKTGVSRLIGTIQDVTDQRAAEEEVQYVATHDVLTGLPNRRVFQDRLEAGLAVGGRDARHGLLMIDIDHFKEVNDGLGHHAGDALLAEVALRLRRSAGEGAIVARLGGDEFAVLILNLPNLANLDRVAGLVADSLSESVRYGDESIPVTASIGVVIGRTGDGADQLLKDADIALYEAKTAGRNRVVRFHRAMREEMELKQSILRSMRQAVANPGNLLLYYQPKTCLRTGGLLGFEALVRWRRPDGAVVGPSLFMPALEDPQLSQIIGDLVLDQALRQAQDWRTRGLAFGTIAINVATSQFRRGDLAGLILTGLKSHGLPPEALTVEVTENVLLAKDIRNVAETLNALSRAGVRISLDDFGTGYASLTHLKDFPVDMLKIDRSFVSNLVTSPESHAIVRAMIGLAHDLGVQVVCEGVETEQQRDILVALGSDFAQGYLFARPMPADLVEQSCFTATGDKRIQVA
ncbi:putative bifunctional diguanylate cyclase/phosphodiesterase [Chthonobacter rhizosphaerae]|uniref:putative bifunctional diguanylate cyclase/phosphodiesterase n=1 Tax=Chthonobacter rhizosphaerae TaxID=2735553 RepID=UPI0015EFB6DE|nr:EAL domain-containing protein [Chthonobacter rhizosphaerae]